MAVTEDILLKACKECRYLIESSCPFRIDEKEYCERVKKQIVVNRENNVLE